MTWTLVFKRFDSGEHHFNQNKIHFQYHIYIMSFYPVSSLSQTKKQRPAQQVGQSRDCYDHANARNTGIYQTTAMCIISASYGICPIIEKPSKTASTCTFKIVGLDVNGQFYPFQRCANLKESMASLLEHLRYWRFNFESKTLMSQVDRIIWFNMGGVILEGENIRSYGKNVYENLFHPLLADRSAESKKWSYKLCVDHNNNLYFKYYRPSSAASSLSGSTQMQPEF